MTDLWVQSYLSVLRKILLDSCLLNNLQIQFLWMQQIVPDYITHKPPNFVTRTVLSYAAACSAFLKRLPFHSSIAHSGAQLFRHQGNFLLRPTAWLPARLHRAAAGKSTCWGWLRKSNSNFQKQWGVITRTIGRVLRLSSEVDRATITECPLVPDSDCDFPPLSTVSGKNRPRGDSA